MFGKMFFKWIGKEGGTDADAVQSEAAPQNNKLSAIDDDVDDDDERGYCDEVDVCAMYACCKKCGAENNKKNTREKSEVLLPRLTGPMWGLRAAEGGENQVGQIYRGKNK